MKWKDAEQAGESENEIRDGYFEENYSPLKRRKFDFGFDAAAILGKPLFWYAVGACIFILLVVIFMTSGKSDSRQLDNVEKRLALAEKRISTMETLDTRVSALEKDIANAQNLGVRLERLETTIAKKLNDMETKINQLTLERSATAKPGATKVHVVQKGDTLFRISKRYGLTVDALRRLNNLGKGATIQPGQKLLVK
jgi:LysM repeat protein